METTLIWTVHTKQAKSQARKEHGGTQGAASLRWTVGHVNIALQARNPNRAKKGARAGAGIGISPKRLGLAVKAPPGRTPAVGARRASAAGSEEPETATDVGRRRDTPRPSPESELLARLFTTNQFLGSIIPIKVGNKTDSMC